ncbi:MAG: A/G-specific adenine glycosylase [Candidatus Promineifilaceae bacterium]
MAEFAEIGRRLLAWWDAGHADLPWRGRRDPYAIWVAEIMLQQTQVATVIPYYERWLAHFPTLADLAAADLDEVLKLWEGLGYYARARNLQAAARTVAERHGGRLPSSARELARLKGIGPYTAGAIASIAFDQPAPILDGNVIRVLTRLFDLKGNVATAATRRRLWQLAEEALPESRPGDFNQALMELGQRICLPAAPRCLLCPLAELCLARQRGTELERPVRPPRKRPPHHDVSAGVIWDSAGRLLVTRRPARGLLGGLWDFPGGRCEPGESPAGALRREISEQLGLEIQVGPQLAIIPHAYTHFRVSLYVFEAQALSPGPGADDAPAHAWLAPAELAAYAFPATGRKIASLLAAGKP